MEMENQIPRIWSLLEQTPWAIQPEKLEQIIEVLRLRATGQEIAYLAANTPRPEPSSNNGIVGVLPVFGMMSHRVNMVSNFSGGTSTEMLGKQLKALADNPEISSIILDINSPGGEVFGMPELAADIRAIRGRKRIVALANPIAASAAYWLGASASEFYSIPSGQVGSIGVYGIHKDVSAAEEKLGVKVSIISAGKYKTEGSEHEPLTEEAKAHMQEMVDAYYGMFVDGVASGRAVKPSEVEGKFGEGRMVLASHAKSKGMIDGIITMDNLLKRELKLSQNGHGRIVSHETTPQIEAKASSAIASAISKLTDEDRQRRLRAL